MVWDAEYGKSGQRRQRELMPLIDLSHTFMESRTDWLGSTDVFCAGGPTDTTEKIEVRWVRSCSSSLRPALVENEPLPVHCYPFSVRTRNAPLPHLLTKLCVLPCISAVSGLAGSCCRSRSQCQGRCHHSFSCCCCCCCCCYCFCLCCYFEYQPAWGSGASHVRRSFHQRH